MTVIHYEGTYVHNELIIENLAWAISQGIEVLPRIPVIPDFNDSWMMQKESLLY